MSKIQREQERITWWGMRANEYDRENIARLAEILGMKQSDAVRHAVVSMLKRRLTKYALDGAKPSVVSELVGFSPRR